jgi:hypothetical protein
MSRKICNQFPGLLNHILFRVNGDRVSSFCKTCRNHFYLSRQKKSFVIQVCFLIFFLLQLFSGSVSFGNQKVHSVLPSPVLSSENFPCSRCHADRQPVTNKKELQFHTEIKVQDHLEKDQRCLDCHDPDAPDVLRLSDGTKVDFTTSYKLCRQCHRSIYKAWQLGVHGKRTGNWDDQRIQYFPCTSCHNPHRPRLKPLAPEPPPMRPEETLRW